MIDPKSQAEWCEDKARIAELESKLADESDRARVAELEKDAMLLNSAQTALSDEIEESTQLRARIAELESENESLEKIISNYCEGTHDKNLARQMEAATKLYHAAEQRAALWKRCAKRFKWAENLESEALKIFNKRLVAHIEKLEFENGQLQVSLKGAFDESTQWERAARELAKACATTHPQDIKEWYDKIHKLATRVLSGEIGGGDE